MSKHKAPWRVETNSMGRVVTVCSAEGWPLARMVEDTDKDTAALIAEAPELLRQLEIARDRIKDMLYEDDGQAFKEARKWLPGIEAAITKAGGTNG